MAQRAGASRLDPSLNDCWSKYTDKSEEKFFRKFVRDFLAKHGKSWDELIKNSAGSNNLPMSELPEELLPALNKFLIVCKDEAEQVNWGLNLWLNFS